MTASWFRQWRDAYETARFRADITGLRYRVRYEPSNQWWDVIETNTPVPGHRRFGRP